MVSISRIRGWRIFIGLALCAAVAGIPLPAAAQDPIHWSLAYTSRDPILAGGLFDVEVTARIDPPWHLYAPTQPAGGPQPLLITVGVSRTFDQIGEISSWLPKVAVDPNFNLETQFFEEHAIFTVPVGVAPFTKDGRYKLPVVITYQTCNDRLCLPPTEEKLALDLFVGKAAMSTSTVTEVQPPTPVAETEAPDVPVAGSRVPDMASASAGASTLSGYLALAVAMGALSLLTPCVFPMVPITVSYFTQRAGRSRREALLQAFVYGLGIVLTFTAAGFTIAIGFGASGLNRFAANPWLNLGVTALFVAFALSLFGVYQVALPSKLVTQAAKADSGRGNYAGTLLMGLAFTLTSFTCTVPFLGTLFVVASQGDWQWPLAGMFAFSVVFAAPFMVLAIAPRLLYVLPRSGVWLIAVKATMGMLELAAAMKFLSNADLVWGWGVFTRPVVIASWILVSAVLTFYLAGFISLGPAPRLGRPGAARLSAAAACLLLAVWLASGLSGRRLGELESFLPPGDLHIAPGTELAWLTNDYDAAIAEARRENRPILVDFTGYTCTNCRWMEANMFPQPDVMRELDQYVRLRLYTDGRGEVYRRNQEMEQEMFGTVALPFYAVLTPAGRPVVSFGGLTRDPNEYLRFLRRGLE